MNTILIFCAKYLFVIPFVIAAIFFLRQPRSIKINMLILGLSSAVISYIVAFIAGKLYFDPRPFVVEHFVPLINHDTENGFPSDHVLLVSSLAAIVTFFSKKLGILLWGFTIIIAIARVYVGVHHSIDVIASMLIAIIVTTILYYLHKKYYQL